MPCSKDLDGSHHEKNRPERTVAAVARRAPPTLGPDNTVQEAAQLFCARQLSYLPVVDAQGRLLGELDATDLLSAGVPHYALQMGALKFLKTLEAFETFLRKKERLKIAAIMKKNPPALEEEASLIEAVVKLSGGGRKYLPVVKEGRLTGVVGPLEILNEVLKA